MKKIVVLLAGLFAFLPCTVFADFYRYKDENGVLRFTDNLSEVPVDQRPKVHSYKESTGSQTPGKQAGEAKPEASGDTDSTEASETRKDKKPTDQEIEKLLEIKAALDKEFAELEKEKQVLANQKGKLKTRSQIKARNEKVTRYNKRLAEYEKRRKAFQKEVDAFNERVKKTSAGQEKKE